MMSKIGWMKLYRKIQDHWLWSDKPFSKGQAWIDMLLLASFEESDFLLGNKVEKNDVGKFFTSELKLADRWGWGRKKVRLFLELLEREGMIEQNRDNRRTAINIVNYGIYSDFEISKEQQKNNEGTTEEQRRNTIKKVKEIKNVKEYKYIKDIYNATCVSFPKLTVLSDRRIKSIQARLNKYSVDDFKTLFEKAEASDFLKGSNNRDWRATFDWLIKDSNMAKVLDGNYDNKGAKKKSDDSHIAKYNLDDFDDMLMNSLPE